MLILGNIKCGKISWSIDKINPTLTDKNDYHTYEQSIAIDVFFSDGQGGKHYNLGTSYLGGPVSPKKHFF